MEKEEKSEEFDIDTSNLSEDVDEGYMSEGEVVPPKRPKKETSKEEVSPNVTATDGNRDVSLTPNKDPKRRDFELPPTKIRQTKEKLDKVCRRWLQHKCRHGRRCEYLHKKNKKRNPVATLEAEEIDAQEVGKPKSLYATVHVTHFPADDVVIERSNGKGKYCLVASPTAFPGAWHIGFKLAIPRTNTSHVRMGCNFSVMCSASPQFPRTPSVLMLVSRLAQNVGTKREGRMFFNSSGTFRLQH